MKFSTQSPQVWFCFIFFLVLFIYNCLQFGNSVNLDDLVEEVVSRLAGGGDSKKASDKNRSLETSLLKVSSADNNCEIAEECIWSQNSNIKDEINLGQVSYLEVTLLYSNQTYLKRS